MEKALSQKASLIAVAPFGATKQDQHLIDDDIWYARFLVENLGILTYIAGAYSAKIIQKKHAANKNISIIPLPKMSNRLVYEYNVIQSLAREMRGKKSIHIIFFGYSERIMLIATPLFWWRNCKITLVNTNNLSENRLIKYRLPMRFMHFLISKYLDRFIVHTDYEKNLALSYFPFLATSIVAKKHHMMMPDSELQKQKINKTDDGKVIVSCFGPITKGKSIDILSSVLDELEKRPKTAPQIDLRLYKIDPKMIPRHDQLPPHIKLSYSKEFLEPVVYRQKIRESDLVIMNHDTTFEGKLSGIFCDCVSLGVPFLALDIEPLSTHDRRLQGLGFLLSRLDQSNWSSTIKVATDPDCLASMRQKIYCFADKFTKKQLDENYIHAFNIKGIKTALKYGL